MTESGLFFASLVLGARGWLWPAVAIVALSAVVLAWAYRGLTGPRWLRITAATLKAVGIALLAAILLDPLWSTSRARPGENVVLLLVDTSQSTQVKGRDQKTSTASAFRERIEDERQPWLVRLKQDFDVRRYTFDSRLEPRTDFAGVEFNGRSSALHASLRSLAERFQGRPVAGIVVMSDGVATDARASNTPTNVDSAALPPVFPVLPPQIETAAEVSLARVTATQTSFEDAPVTLLADATSQGFEGEPLVCEVLDEAGKVLHTQEQTPGGRDASATFRFQFRPEREGLSFYRVRVAAKSQLDVWKDVSKSREATLANNERLVQVDRGRGPYRILYVGGAPNPEHKFLGRALAEDSQIELLTLMRIARREPKFDFRTRAGESTNPLFRGFDKTTDETERYDQPVFVRLGIKDERELRDGFPKNVDQLFGYHAIILDDVEAELFTTDQMSLIGRFVSERGGGLLMLGGPDGFEKGKFAKTPVADVLPVYLQRTTTSYPPPAEGYRWQLTREGWLEPWMRLRASEADERERLEKMPATFRSLNHIAGIKPGASILAVAVDPAAKQHPALVVHTYGRGRAAALMIGDMWRWRLKSEPENQDLEKTWRQLIRWLAGDVPGRVSVAHELVADELAPAVRLAIRARDADFQPLDNAAVTLQVTPPDGKPLAIDAEPSRSEPGVYEASYVPRAPGAYRALAKVVDGAGAELGQVETGWTNDSAADEFRALTPDRAALAELARATQGETIELSELDDFAASLAARPVKETVQTLFPLWHTSGVFLLAIACLAGEWGLRRWRGLP
ncbi:MAG: hypothetical protein JNM18_14895 [Planctomycetaceae bacterium]|nr:hypothetical protein [Planctomycetaceae bacterium]